MKIPIKQWLKQNLSFSKKDRNAIIFLSILILLALSVYILADYIQFQPEQDFSEYRQMLEEWQAKNKESHHNKETLFPFNPNTIPSNKLDSLLLPRFVKQNILSYRAAGGTFSSDDDVRKIYGMNDSIFKIIQPFIQIPKPESKERKQKAAEVPKAQASVVKTFSGSIDPNNAGLDELIRFGFSKFQANNIVEYRKNGGRFGLKNDLLKIYGLDSAFYAKIESHIYIESQPEKEYPSPPAEKNMVKVELNSADTTSLMQLAGIGSVFASRIIKYRDLLGGYRKKKQLLEVYNFPEETYQNIQNNVIVDTTEVKKIRLNFATYAQLLRHPYLNEESVKAILDYRNKNGPYSSVHQILEKQLVDSTTYLLVRDYLSCR